MMHETVIVHHPRSLQLRNQLLGRRPRRRRIPPRSPASAEFRQDINGAAQNVLLLLRRELGDILVRVAVQADFVAGVADFGDLRREGLEAVGGGKEGGFDVGFGEEDKEAVDAYCRAVDAAADICGVLGRAGCGVDPVCDGVYVDWVRVVLVLVRMGWVVMLWRTAVAYEDSLWAHG